ncbi:unnamed protein product [Cladocopium goreaui]|uniref:Uncharacterized protein n=1 Tax=Cladocopium goreaui TaxID=2562237 RepID=A0A9P1GMC1_9DINO|nr:unnamed protein product [Cladocopium goreaui]
MPARPTKQLHQCSLCGRKGHNVLRCEAPGAARYRKLLAIYKDDQRLNSKQTGRKGKTRPRRQKFGDRKNKAKDTYSGKRKRLQDDKVRREKRRKQEHLKGDEQNAVKELQKIGFLKAPQRCPFCKRYNLNEADNKGKTVEYRCKWAYCRKRITALNHSYGLPQSLGRGLSATGLLVAIRSYCAATKCVSPLAVAQTIGCSEKPIARLYTCLREMEAKAGAELNYSMRLRKEVELDGHKVRTAWVSKKTTKFLPQAKCQKAKNFILHYGLEPCLVYLPVGILTTQGMFRT